MTDWGLCDNANFEESTLTQDEARELKARIRRTLVLPDWNHKLRVINSARQLQAQGVPTLVVYTTQSSHTDFYDVDGYCRELDSFLSLAEGTIFGVEIQNELDTPHWGISDDEIVYVAQRGAEVVKRHGLKAFAPSLLSGPEEGRFEYIAKRIHNDVDYMAVHPYYCSCGGYPRAGWFYGTVEHKANVCAELCPWIPTAFTEGGCPTGYDNITQQQQAGYFLSARHFQHPAIAYFINFCRDDYMVPDEEIAEGKAWGLISRDGERKFAYNALQVVNMDYEYVLGFKEWHDYEPDLLGDPLENEHGGIEGLSQQKTSRGLLTWAHIAVPGGVRTFYEWDTGKRYALYAGEQQSVEI